MKLMDKIKNALFEEEYVEVEEKPKVKKKPKRKLEPFENMEEEVEEPIAKRIVPPAKREEVVHTTREIPVVNNNSVDNSFDNRDSFSLNNTVKEEKKFTMVSDYDLKPDDDISPSVSTPVSKEEVRQTAVYTAPVYNEVSIREVKNEEVQAPYQAGKKNGYLDNYTVHEYGGKAKEKTYFKPSPVISPIYGIIDDPAKKEEYHPPREVRLSSSLHEKINLDDVRKKAFGGLEEDICNVDNNIVVKESEPSDDNLLVDLRDDRNVVEVEKLTMGDAVEYFEDLGLEYNNDYIDATKERAVGRRVKSDEEYENIPSEETNEVKDDNLSNTSTDITSDNDVAPDFLKQKEVSKEEKSDEENLFDLIDSMYDK